MVGTRQEHQARTRRRERSRAEKRDGYWRIRPIVQLQQRQASVGRRHVLALFRHGRRRRAVKLHGSLGGAGDLAWPGAQNVARQPKRLLVHQNKVANAGLISFKGLQQVTGRSMNSVCMDGWMDGWMDGYQFHLSVLVGFTSKYLKRLNIQVEE